MPPRGDSRSIAASTSCLDRVGWLHDVAGVAERDDTDADGRRLVVDERRRAACFAAAIRVGSRSFAFMLARHVEREDHGALPAREVDGRLRPGQPDEQHDDADEEHQRAPRGAASPADGRYATSAAPSCRARARRRCAASDQPRGSRRRAPARASSAEQRAGAWKRHRCPRCLRSATMRTSARTRSSSVDRS